MVEIKQYTPELSQDWNRFVDESKNATFLHRREYMDYHSHRFEDCSLIAHDNGKIVALLPANRVGDTLYSHQGLTYGGWLTQLKHFNAVNMLEIFDAMKEFCLSIGIKHLIYKAIPHIYHKYPAEEDLYAIFRQGGNIIETNISSSIPLDQPLDFNYTYRKMVKTAIANNLSVVESQDYAQYWNILTELLGTKYDTTPVHSLDEITMLHDRFPHNIKLYTVNKYDEMLAGVLIYCTPLVAHAQYIASNEEGKNKGALALLFNHLIKHEFKGLKYLDLGTSNENKGLYLNEGLILQKSHLGGRAIVHNTYKISF
jgi:hypothetical protein